MTSPSHSVKVLAVLKTALSRNDSQMPCSSEVTRNSANEMGLFYKMGLSGSACIACMGGVRYMSPLGRVCRKKDPKNAGDASQIFSAFRRRSIQQVQSGRSPFLSSAARARPGIRLFGAASVGSGRDTSRPR